MSWKRPSTTALPLKTGAGFWTIATMVCESEDDTSDDEDEDDKSQEPRLRPGATARPIFVRPGRVLCACLRHHVRCLRRDTS